MSKSKETKNRSVGGFEPPCFGSQNRRDRPDSSTTLLSTQGVTRTHKNPPRYQRGALTN